MDIFLKALNFMIEINLTCKDLHKNALIQNNMNQNNIHTFQFLIKLKFKQLLLISLFKLKITMKNLLKQ